MSVSRKEEKMKKTLEIIKKLQSEHGVSGVHAVADKELKALISSVKERNQTPYNNLVRQLGMSSKINDSYYWLSGFLWGLHATGYILFTECDEATDELMRIAEGCIPEGEERTWKS